MFRNPYAETLNSERHSRPYCTFHSKKAS